MKQLFVILSSLFIFGEVHTKDINFTAFDSETNQAINLDSIVISDLEYNITTTIYNDTYHQLSVDKPKTSALKLSQISEKIISIVSDKNIDGEYRIFSYNGETIDKGSIYINEGINRLNLIPDEICGVNFIQIIAGKEIANLRIIGSTFSVSGTYYPVAMKLLNEQTYDVKFFSKGYYTKTLKNISLLTDLSVIMKKINSKYLFTKAQITLGNIELMAVYFKSNYIINDTSYSTIDTSSYYFNFNEYLDMSINPDLNVLNYTYCDSYPADHAEFSTGDTVFINYEMSDIDYSSTTIYLTKIVFDSIGSRIISFDMLKATCFWQSGGGDQADSERSWNCIGLKNIEFTQENDNIIIELNSTQLNELLENNAFGVHYDYTERYHGSGTDSEESVWTISIKKIPENATLKIVLSQ